MLGELLVITLVVRHKTQNTTVYATVSRFIGVLSKAEFIFARRKLTLAHQSGSHNRLPHPSCAELTCGRCPEQPHSLHRPNEHTSIVISWLFQFLEDKSDLAVDGACFD